MRLANKINLTLLFIFIVLGLSACSSAQTITSTPTNTVTNQNVVTPEGILVPAVDLNSSTMNLSEMFGVDESLQTSYDVSAVRQVSADDTCEKITARGVLTV